MTEIDPSYWEPPDDPDAEDRFFGAFADVVTEATELVDCPRGCGTLARCDEPGPDCSLNPPPAAPGERFGAGVCSSRVCDSPCGPNGGCVR